MHYMIKSVVSSNREEGVYETVDPNYLIVDVDVFSGMLTPEQAKEKLRDEVIKEYLEQVGSQKRRGENMEDINRKRKAVAEANKLSILDLIILGMSKDEVQSSLNLSIATINRALKDIDPLELTVMFNQHENSYFADVTPEALHMFIQADCNYKKYRKALSTSAK